MKRNLGIFTTVLLGGALVAHAQDGVSFGGYVDAQYNWNNTKDTGGVSNADSSVNTFRFNEGAVYLSKKVGGAEVFVDLDFAGPAKSATSGFTGTPVAEDWTVGESKSQAYVSMSYDNGFAWRLGQFDSLFGFEGNDTHTIKYAAHGVMWDQMPVTHVGWHGSYEFSDMFTVHGLVANPYNQGHMNNGNLDFGLKANTKFDSFNFNLGVLVNTGDHEATGNDKQSGYIVDMDIGSNWGMWDAALYGYASKGDTKGTKTDFGVGVDLGMKWSDTVHGGLRFEWLKDGTESAAAPKDATIEVTVGPQFHLAEGFVAKLDYTWESISYDSSISSESQVAHSINLAGVFKF